MSNLPLEENKKISNQEYSGEKNFDKLCLFDNILLNKINEVDYAFNESNQVFQKQQ